MITMKTILLSLLFFVICLGLTAQVPQGFNYQAIARDPVTTNPITNKLVKVKLSILSDTTGFYASGSGTYIYEEEHVNIRTNGLGLFTVALGTGTKIGGSSTFSSISWTAVPLYMGVKIAVETAYVYKNMGSAKLWTVPYAMAASKAETAGKADGITTGAKLSVVSADDATSLALFEVKRKDGQTVFAVYPDAVNVYVPPTAKGGKGGFAIGGFGTAKAPSQDYFRVTDDSVRIYIDDTPGAKGSKGGFAIGGFDKAKAGFVKNYYMNISGTKTVDTVKGSPQILWFPNKNAFLAGNVRIPHIDSIGDYSSVLGYQSQAPGDYSQAFGYKAKAFGDYSTSIGRKSIAGVYQSKHNAFAFGYSAMALGEDSYALGSGAKATGLRSFAFGSVGLDDGGNPTIIPTTASADYTVAIGMGAQATAKGGLALGIGSSAQGLYSNAFGYYSTTGAGANYATALGFRSNATGINSGTLGSYATAAGSYSLALGYFAESSSGASYSTALGYFAQADGLSSIAIGNRAWAIGQYSVAAGDSAKTQANYAAAFGRMAKAKGLNSVAVGYNAQVTTAGSGASAFGQNAAARAANSTAVGYGAQVSATGTDASAFGKSAIANGPSSTAIGIGSTTGSGGTNASAFGNTAAANGLSSLALGTNTTAGGSYSTAIGYLATAAGGNAISLGNSTAASASSSAAIGTSAQATATNAFALGTQTIASGANSIAMGYQTTSSGDKSVAIGSFYSTSIAIPRLIITKGGGDGDGDTKGIDDFLIIRPPTLYTTFPRTFSRNNTAEGQYSIAIGNGNKAQNGGLAFGSNNDAIKFGALALGTSALANETNSVAIGYDATANGIYSVALGNNVTAGSYGELALGQWNSIITGAIDTWRESDLLFTIGNGTSSTDRSNALTIYKDGKANLLGRYASTTFNYKIKRTLFRLPPLPPLIRDYVYGVYSLLNRDDTSIEYYYSGFFAATGTAGSYKGLYADLFSTPEASITTLYSSGAYSTAVGASPRDLYVDNTGYVGYLSSSIRYKKDIEELSDISWLYDLRPVTYRYKTSNSVDKEIGLIAEEVLKVNPQFVSLNDKGEPETVTYSQLVTPLLKAVQDQKATIDGLKSENEMLRERLEKLENAILSLTKEQK